MATRGGQFGGGIMGGVSLQAGSDNIQNFRNMRPGPVSALLIKLGFSIKSTAAAFALVIDSGSSAAGEGVDDLDLLSNAMYAAFTLLWDQFTQAFNLTPAQVRTILGFLNLRDLLSTLVNGTSCPVSSGAVLAASITLWVPVQLGALIADGNMFSNGSARLSLGQMNYKTGSSLGPTVVLANGSAVVSAMTTDIKPQSGAGDEGDVGPVWQASNPSGIQTVYNFPAGHPYLAVLDRSPAATNAASGISIGEFENLDPTYFAQLYEQLRIQASSGYDVTARCTPYLWPTPNSKFEDMVARFGQGAPRIQIASGVTDFDAYVIQVLSPDQSVVGAVSQVITAGGPVAQTPITPQTRAPGAAVHAGHASFLPVRIQPAAFAGGAAMKSLSPTAAASQAGAAGQKRQTLLSLAAMK